MKRRLAVVLATAAVVAALVASVQLVPEQIAYATPGADGWARGPYAEARVVSVQLTKLVDAGSSRQLSTDNVFVVVELEVAAHRVTAPLGDIGLRTRDGRTYVQRGELPGAELPAVDPGFRVAGIALFELPPERVAGADLVIVPHRSGLEYFRSGLRFPAIVPDDAPLVPAVTPASARTEVAR